MAGLWCSKNDAPQGDLDKAQILQVIRAHRDGIRSCYERQLVQAPSLEGRVLLRFVVLPTGAVGSASVRESTLASPALEACLIEQVRSWTFPSLRGGEVVGISYPFIFKLAPDPPTPDAGPSD